MNKLSLIVICSLVMVPAKKYHAFEVFAGKGLVNTTTVSYAPCQIDIAFSGSSFTIGSERYHIDYTEKFGDTLLAYFGHSLVPKPGKQCSFLAIPPQSGKEWTLLFTWQDSCKSYHANVVQK